MIKIAVTGATGRMGKSIIASISQNPLVELAGALEREDSPFLGKDALEMATGQKSGVKLTSDMEKAFKKASVIIDFTTPEASIKHMALAAAEKKAIVIGTTGFSLHHRDEIKALSSEARVVMAPNMSVGVNLLLKLVQDTAAVLGSEYDIEIVEVHHRHKKDAPSGTAVRIAEVIASTLNRDLEKVAVYERKGIVGERRPEEIGIQSVRAGDVVGDHTVIFGGPGERIELVHKASSRDTFAAGAVKAAIWLSGKPNGLYDMQDVLGLKG